MMRRSAKALTGLTGNAILGIRREDKNVWERRVPLTPSQVKQLLERGSVKKVFVQPSAIRCYNDEEYLDAGAELNEDLSEASTICAVKEVPPHLLIPERTYLFFSHTIKAQPYNMGLLDTMLDKKVRLIDYERIVGPHGRLVKFGPYAGFAGMIDTLNGLGKALLLRGYATPFLNVSLSKEYRSLATAREDLLILGNIIRRFGIPRELGPLTFAVTGAGAVSLAAQEMLHHLPCKYVMPEDLPRLWKQKDFDNKHIYVVVVTAKDMVEHKMSDKKFDKQEYYAKPELYRPTYHEKIAPFVHVLVNGIYWEEKYPRLLTNDQAQTLKKQGRFPMVCLGDITCDVGGSVEMFVKATTIQNPFYAYDVDSGKVIDEQDYNGEGVLILGVDHLPAEFPREASTDFGKGLVPLVEKVVVSNGHSELAEQKNQLSDPIYAGMVTNSGSLTPHFEYIADLRAENEAKTASAIADANKTNNVLVIGSGMTAGPAVEEILRNPNNRVTVADTNADSMAALKKNYGNENVNMLNSNAAKMEQDLKKAISSSDVVVSLLPATMHHIIAKETIPAKKPLVTASYTSPAMKALEEEAKANGTFVINELGLDPGIDIMTTAKMLHNIRADGGVVKSYVSLCGALPAPEFSNCPLGYKFSWFPRGVLTAANRPTKFRVGGDWFEVPGRHLFHLIQPSTNFAGMDLHWIPNGDATPYSGLYSLPDSEAVDVLRGTFRYRSYAPAITTLQALGLVDDQIVLDMLKTSTPKSRPTWNSVVNALLDAKGAAPNDSLRTRAMDYAQKTVCATFKEVQDLPAYQALIKADLLGKPIQSRTTRNVEEEVFTAIEELEKLGLFSYETAEKTGEGAVIDSLCATMQASDMAYKPHERDFVLMLHRVKAYFPATNKNRVYTATLTQRGESVIRSATSLTVGAPVGIATNLVLDGAFSDKRGLIVPTQPSLYDPVLFKLDKLGVRMHETVEEE